MSKSKNLVSVIVAEIERIAKQLDVHPSTLTKSQFMKHSKHTDWELRKIGGLGGVIKAHFPQDDKELVRIEDVKRHKAYISKLEKEVGRSGLLYEDLINKLAEIVATQKVEPLSLDAKETKKFLERNRIDPKLHKDQAKRSICTIWSDQHFGTNIDKKEMNGKNEYNWKIGARRLGMLCEQIATYKIEKRHLHEELVIFLLGDNIAGVIHNQEGFQTDLITDQIAGTAKYYMQAISYLSQFFPKVRVECQTGNHGRVMHKMSHDRAMQQKWDSHETAIFIALAARFADNPNISINVPKCPYSDVMVQGHRIFATHGDTVFEVGNPGQNVALSKIQQRINTINGGVPDGEPKYSMFCTGHVHHPVYTHVGEGVKVIVNGCLIGTDPYALGVGIANSQPAQVVWEATKSHVQGDIRTIYANEGDDNADYEKIIRPYHHDIVEDYKNSK